MTYSTRLLGLGWLLWGLVGCGADESGDSDNSLVAPPPVTAQGGATSNQGNRGGAMSQGASNSNAYGMGGMMATSSSMSLAMSSTTAGGATSLATGTAGPVGGAAAAVTGTAPPASGGTSGEVIDADAGTTTPSTDRCAALDATKPLQLYLSSDDSNSMASPAIARSLIQRGGVPPSYIIRTYEFLNYYDLGYQRSSPGQLAVSLEMAEGEGSGTYALQIGVSSEAAVVPRRPMSITFVLDTSGSMSGEPIARSKAAVKAIAASLKPGDIVSAVTWNDTNSVVLDSRSVTGSNDAMVVAMADAMQANGSTNLNAGLQRGYELAQKNFVASHLNRVVLISDGQANTGVTDENIIARGADLNDGDGIYLVGVGVGDGVNDTLMNTVTDKGRGAYVYLDSQSEAWRMFVTRFDESMDVAARAVQVRLDLPWYLGVTQFYGEQMSTNPRVVEPQHLAPNDAMVFDQVLRPCSEQQFSSDDPVAVTVNWVTPTTHEPRSTSSSSTLGVLLGAPAPHLPKAQAIIAYAEALKAGSTQAKVTAARAKVARAMAIGSDADLQEIDTLLQALDALVN